MSRTSSSVDVGFTFKESELRNLIGTSSLQNTLKDVVGELKTMKAWAAQEIATKFEEAEVLNAERAQEQSAQILQMREELLSSTKRDLNREISKLNETVNTKLQKVTILQDSVDKLTSSQETVALQMAELTEKFTVSEAKLLEALELVDGACQSATVANRKLDTALEAAAADKAGMQARVGAAEQAAKAAERKADEACDGVIEAREEMDTVNRLFPELQGKVKTMEELTERNSLAAERLTRALNDATTQMETEFGEHKSTFEQLQAEQQVLGVQISSVTKQTCDLPERLETIKAEQLLGVKRLEERIDRSEGMIKLKANHNDLVRLIGAKADRDVIDALASERIKFLREVNSKMIDVENQVCDKADKMDVEGFAKEQQVTALLKQQAADLTTFVATTVNEAIEDKATIQDCAQLQKRIEEVTGEVVSLTEEEADKVDARLNALRNQLVTKADQGALKKMNTKIKAMAETSFTEQSTDAASLFFRCLSCDTKLPRLEGQQAIQAIGGMLPQQPVAPVMGRLLESCEHNQSLKEFLTSVKFDSRPETADSAYPPGGPPGSSEGRRLLLTGSDGRLYKGLVPPTPEQGANSTLSLNSMPRSKSPTKQPYNIGTM